MLPSEVILPISGDFPKLLQKTLEVVQVSKKMIDALAKLPHGISSALKYYELFLSIWRKKLQGLKSWGWGWLPKFCRTFGILCEGSSTGFLLCKGSAEPSCRTQKILQNFFGGGGLGA